MNFKLKTENLPAKIFVQQKLRRESKLKNSFGFSLIEMVTVIGVFAFLSSIVFANYTSFNVNASLDNLTHQIAIAVRQAQVYGISVSGLQGQFKRGYGVYFSTENESNKKVFVLFNDKNSNGVYDPGACDGSGECIEKTTIQTGDAISKIVTGEKMSNVSVPPELKNVSIVFIRPNPDAIMSGTLADDSRTALLSDVEIYLSSIRGSSKKIVIWSTGQVSVE